MRFGASTDLRFGQNNIEFLEILYLNGFSHIEIRKDSDYVYGQVNHIEMKKILSEYDFTVSYHAPHRDFNLASVNEDLRKCCVAQVIAMGEYLHEVGQGWVNIHAGQVSKAYQEDTIEKAKDNCIRSLDEIAEAFEFLDTKVFLENDSNEKGLIKFGLSPDQIGELLGGFPEFYMTFDLGHSHHSGFNSLCFIKPFGDRIRAVHLHDNKGTEDEHLAVGEGTVDFKSALKCLKDCCENYIFEMKSISDIIKSKECIESLKIFDI